MAVLDGLVRCAAVRDWRAIPPTMPPLLAEVGEIFHIAALSPL